MQLHSQSAKIGCDRPLPQDGNVVLLLLLVENRHVLGEFYPANLPAALPSGHPSVSLLLLLLLHSCGAVLLELLRAGVDLAADCVRKILFRGHGANVYSKRMAHTPYVLGRRVMSTLEI